MTELEVVFEEMDKNKRSNMMEIVRFKYDSGEKAVQCRFW